MKEVNRITLRESMAQLPTGQLDAMLRAELEKDVPDENAVRLILGVLREREKNIPVESTAQLEKTWMEYERKTAVPKTRAGNGILKAASVLIVIGMLLFALPQEANAKSFFNRIAEWTDSIFALFSPDEPRTQSREYVFRTDHPGLQELYDTVTELGVNVPVVPMWLDESYELKECKVLRTSAAVQVSALFYDGSKETVMEIIIYSRNTVTELPKNEKNAAKYEVNGVTHNILENEGIWAAVWTIDNIECALSLEGQEETLEKVLNSIYSLEE